MNKQKKQFVIIAILLVALLAVFFGVKSYNKTKEEEKAEKESAEEIHVTDFAAEDVTAFSYQNGDEIISLKKDGENWIYEQDDSVDIDEDVVSSMLSAVAELKATDAFEAEMSLEEYGLSAPANTIVLTTESQEITLYLGDYNSLVESYYLKTGDSERIYLVDSTISTQFSKTIADITYVEEETETVESTDTTELTE